MHCVLWSGENWLQAQGPALIFLPQWLRRQRPPCCRQGLPCTVVVREMANWTSWNIPGDIFVQPPTILTTSALWIQLASHILHSSEGKACCAYRFNAVAITMIPLRVLRGLHGQLEFVRLCDGRWTSNLPCQHTAMYGMGIKTGIYMGACMTCKAKEWAAPAGHTDPAAAGICGVQA